MKGARRCERCDSPIDQDRPGYTTRSGREVHSQCPEFEGEMVSVAPFVEVFEVYGVPRIVYTDWEDIGCLREDVALALEEYYDRKVSLGTFVEEAATWVVPSPTQFNGLVWVCRTDGWAPDDGLEE